MKNLKYGDIILQAYYDILHDTAQNAAVDKIHDEEIINNTLDYFEKHVSDELEVLLLLPQPAREREFVNWCLDMELEIDMECESLEAEIEAPQILWH